MAKKAAKSSGDEVNKSQAIRDYLKENSSEGPTAVASALNAKHGWDISAAYVSTIKNKTKPSGRSSRSAATKVAKGGSLNENSLIQAKELAKQAGGISQAKAALDLLAKLTG
jgi:transglutaminase/protease-like cytokinesis protein 3